MDTTVGSAGGIYGPYRSPVLLARVLLGFMWFYVVLVVFGIILYCIDMALIDMQVSEGSVEELVQMILAVGFLVNGLLTIVIYLGCATCFMLWFYRVRCNVDAWGQLGLWRPFWAWLGFLLCLANVFVPYVLMEQVYKASDPELETGDEMAWKSAPGHSLLGFWWVFWLVSNWVSNFVFKMDIGSGMSTDELTADTISVFSSVLDLCAAVLCIGVIQAVTTRQQRKAEHVAKTGVTRRT